MPYGYYCAHEAYEVGLEGGVYENAWGVVGKCVNGRVVEDKHFLDGKSPDVEPDVVDESPASVLSSSNLVRPTAVMEQNSNVVPQDLEEVLEPFLEPVKCNLCQPGQIGINADIPLDGGRTVKCIDIYEYYLQNFYDKSKQCRAAQNWLKKICCGDGSLMDSAQSTTMTTSTTTLTTRWTHFPTKMPISLAPTPLPTPSPIPRPSANNTSLASIYAEDYLPACASSYDSNNSYTINDQVSHWGGNYICTKETWCSQADFEPRIGQYWEVVWEYQGTCKGNARPTNPGSFRPSDLAEESTDKSDEQPQPPPSRPSEVENKVTADTLPTEIADSIQEPTVYEGLVVSTDPPPPPPPPRPTEVENDHTTDISAAIGDDPQCPEAWKLDYDYAEGDKVSAKGQIYACKEFPYTGWCGQAAYEPANGDIWSSAWTLGADCVGGETREPTSKPSNEPTPVPITPIPTDAPLPTTPSPTKDPSSPTTTPTTKSVPDNDPDTLTEVYRILEERRDVLDNEIFLYQGSEPSTVYRYDGFVAGLRVMTESGVAGKFYYLGNADDNAHLYGLVNLAAFIGQSMKETIQYDACDENSWDLVDGKYPLSNACGQLGQKYQEYHCSEEEKHMECPVDPNMSIKGVTHAKWHGAPSPLFLFCGPKTEYPFKGFWDYGYGCSHVIRIMVPWGDRVYSHSQIFCDFGPSFVVVDEDRETPRSTLIDKIESKDDNNEFLTIHCLDGERHDVSSGDVIEFQGEGSPDGSGSNEAFPQCRVCGCNCYFLV